MIPREFTQKNALKTVRRKEFAVRHKRFYEHPLVILFITFLFFPMGLYLFYRYGECSRRTKVLAIAGVLAFICALWFYYTR